MNGICDSGPQKNGTCKPGSCTPGFHGTNCDQRDIPCPGSVSRRCHVHATCIRGGNVDSCQCNAGYEGSGLQCTEIDPCSKPNYGGCHHEAICTKTGPGSNNCSCDNGFRGDGFVCVAIDPCIEQDAGNCHSNADCQYIGPGQSICVCKPGYTGSGSTCSEINPCLVNNGGCSLDAKCMRTGPGNYSCHCNSGFIGDGYFCFGSVATIISRINPGLENLIRQGHMLHYLSDPRQNLTMFAPSILALSQLPDTEKKYWTNSTERLQYLIRYCVYVHSLKRHNTAN
ncbi:stabilin-1-like [Orbicella faveolata]|uniref:stabilin-1-like n=1 Tax=Orbicella faveolata TaxID=48498 RepID=UPI0009E4196B|nr:stabilin-1-like [Orbicella faveolata]